MDAKNQDRQGIQKGQRIENPMTGRLLSIKQAACYSGLTTWAVRELIWAGALPVVQFKGARKQWIDRADIDTMIERNKRVIQ